MENDRYRPAQSALDRLEHVNFVAVIGPTGVGKSTLITEAIKRDPSLHLVLVSTSRYPRPGEQDGIDYKFESRAHMEEQIFRGAYAQVAPSLFGDLYASAAEDYSTEGVAMMAVLADAMPVFRDLPFKSIREIFVLPPDWKVWQERIKNHAYHADQLAPRLDEAERSLAYAQSNGKLQFVINKDLGLAIKDFGALAAGKPLSKRQQDDQDQAHIIVRNLLKDLKEAKKDPKFW